MVGNFILSKLKTTFFITALLLMNVSCSAESNTNYADIEALQYFYSVKIEDENNIELIMLEHSVPATLHYKSESERKFNLKKGESLEVFLDKAKNMKYVFRFIGIKGESIVGKEELILNGNNVGETNVKFKAYPNL